MGNWDFQYFEDFRNFEDFRICCDSGIFWIYGLDEKMWIVYSVYNVGRSDLGRMILVPALGWGTENLSTPGSWSPGVQAGARRVGKDLLTYWGRTD